MLDKLDELGIADDTVVLYSTDNGPHFNTWPDAGITPFRSEKNTNSPSSQRRVHPTSRTGCCAATRPTAGRTRSTSTATTCAGT
jgi:hypothetical protein